MSTRSTLIVTFSSYPTLYVKVGRLVIRCPRRTSYTSNPRTGESTGGLGFPLSFALMMYTTFGRPKASYLPIKRHIVDSVFLFFECVTPTKMENDMRIHRFSSACARGSMFTQSVGPQMAKSGQRFMLRSYLSTMKTLGLVLRNTTVACSLFHRSNSIWILSTAPWWIKPGVSRQTAHPSSLRTTSKSVRSNVSRSS
jgi:hypothetical protein